MNDIKEKFNNTLENIATQPIKEGAWTKQVENQTAKIPSMAFLSLAVGSIAISAGLKLVKRTSGSASFVGLWAPTFLLLGIYNKLVKLEGNYRHNRA
jgi:hypothetical protein